jgi:uncharacterized Fe-S center protein
MKSTVFFIRARASETDESLSNKARSAYLRIGLNKKLEKTDFIALKIHFGEKNNRGHIKAAWLRSIIGEILKKTPLAYLTDSNTLYVGHRSNSIEHIRLAWRHGFTPEAVEIPVIIADGLIGRDSKEGKGRHSRVASPKIASALLSSDALLCLTHVTGHVQTGIGAAIKNLGMGCASRAGKLDQHSTAHPRVNPKYCRNCGICFDYCPAQAIVQAEGHVLIDDKKCIGCGECLVVCKYAAVKLRWDEDTCRIQEKVSEYARHVQMHFKTKIGFMNFLIKVTKDCDCMAKDQPRIVEDIGILASADPVAIDKASADLVIGRSGQQDVFRSGYDIDWSVQLKHGESIGLGSMDYDLIEISEPSS